jgi:hypothetical protein
MNVFIGIDPGLSGAVAAIDGKLEVLGLEDAPTMKVKGSLLYDVPGMAALLRRFALLGDPVVILEQAQAMPGQGTVSTFHTGYGFGLWCGILGALALPYRTVRPSTWTRKVLAGVPGEGKARSVTFALRMFPGAELVPEGCRRPRDGRSDALCLAYWGLGEANGGEA